MHGGVVGSILTAVPTVLIKTIKPNLLKWLIITLQLIELIITAPASSSMKEPRTGKQACFCFLRQMFCWSGTWNSPIPHDCLRGGELSLSAAKDGTLPVRSMQWFTFPHLYDLLFHSPGYCQVYECHDDKTAEVTCNAQQILNWMLRS